MGRAACAVVGGCCVFTNKKARKFKKGHFSCAQVIFRYSKIVIQQKQRQFLSITHDCRILLFPMICHQTTQLLIQCKIFLVRRKLERCHSTCERFFETTSLLQPPSASTGERNPNNQLPTVVHNFILLQGFPTRVVYVFVSVSFK